MTEPTPGSTDPADPTGTPGRTSPANPQAPADAPSDPQWWRSASLMILVGGVVIAYQVAAYTGEGGMWLNAVMIVIGAAVVVAGLLSLRRAHTEHLARTGARQPTTDRGARAGREPRDPGPQH